MHCAAVSVGKLQMGSSCLGPEDSQFYFHVTLSFLTDYKPKDEDNSSFFLLFKTHNFIDDIKIKSQMYKHKSTQRTEDYLTYEESVWFLLMKHTKNISIQTR